MLNSAEYRDNYLQKLPMNMFTYSANNLNISLFISQVILNSPRDIPQKIISDAILNSYFNDESTN